MSEDLIGEALVGVAGLAVVGLLVVALLAAGLLSAVTGILPGAKAVGDVVGAAPHGCSVPVQDLTPQVKAADGEQDMVSRLTAGFDAPQMANVRSIVQAGQDADVAPRGWVIAVATAIQESGLRNVGHGDQAGPDSRGLFQQRSPWGPLAARMDPVQSAGMFFTGGRGGQPGLLDIPRWQELPLTQAAQAVQRSAHPQAYARHEQRAAALVLAVMLGNGLDATPEPGGASAGGAAGGEAGAGGGSGVLGLAGREVSDLAGLLGLGDRSCDGGGSHVVSAAIAFARSQLGQPYLWGGDGAANGEDGFDCSGLTHAAFHSAGLEVPRTAQEQFDQGPHVLLSLLVPGDLVFFGPDRRHIGHVGIYVGQDQMIDAPHTGAVVRVENYHWPDLIGATRPTAATQP